MKTALFFITGVFLSVTHGGWGMMQWALWLAGQLPIWMLFGYLLYERKALAYRIVVVAVVVEAVAMSLIFLAIRWPRVMHAGWWLILFIPAFWAGINFAISYTGGWWDLSRTYPLNHRFPNTNSWRASRAFLTALGTYRNLVDVAVDSDGLYLRVAAPFRIGHPPIFVPWKDITYAHKKRFFRAMTKFRFRQRPEIPLHLPTQLTSQVAAAASGNWPN
jgi:hypothetical protein